MKSLLRCALFVALTCSLPACRSTSGAELRCTCGTPEADLEGCPHEACATRGVRNPDNVDCVCGTLSIPR